MREFLKSVLVGLSACFAFGCESPPDASEVAVDQAVNEPEAEPAPDSGPIGQWVIDVDRTVAEAMKLEEADRPPIDAIRGQMRSMKFTLAEDGTITIDPGIPALEPRIGRWTAEGNELQVETNSDGGRDPSRVYLNDSDELIMEDENQGRIWTMVLRRADG